MIKPKKPKILCPFCSAPWSDDCVAVFDASASDGCKTCGWGASATVSISITCQSCGKEMYRKEGISA